MPFFKTSSGINLHYEIYPRSSPTQLTFIHGHLGSSRWWSPMIEILQKSTPFTTSSLSESILCIDFHGCGKSDSPKNIINFNIQTVIDDLHDLIVSVEKKSIHLVGHSAGGLLSLHLLGLDPNKYTQGFLVSPVGLNGLNFNDELFNIFEQMTHDKILTSKIIGSTIYKNDYTSDFFKTTIAEDAFFGVQKLNSLFLKILRNLNSEYLIPKIHSRIEIIHGEHDLILPIQDSIELAKKIKQATFHKIQDCGHCPLIENPQLVSSFLLRFLFASV